MNDKAGVSLRRLVQLVGKASFSAEGDKFSALELIEELFRANQGPAMTNKPMTEPTRHVRHLGGGLIALFQGDEMVREIGVTPGWDFKDRDEFIVRYNDHATRLAQQPARGGEDTPVSKLLHEANVYIYQIDFGDEGKADYVRFEDVPKLIAAAFAQPRTEQPVEAYCGYCDNNREVLSAIDDENDDTLKPCPVCRVAGKYSTEQPAAEGRGEVVGEVCERVPCSYSKVVLFDSDLPHGTKLYAATPPRADADVDIKALYTKWHGTDAGWLGAEGSYFTSGVQAALAAAINQGEK